MLSSSFLGIYGCANASTMSATASNLNNSKSHWRKVERVRCSLCIALINCVLLNGKILYRRKLNKCTTTGTASAANAHKTVGKRKCTSFRFSPKIETDWHLFHQVGEKLLFLFEDRHRRPSAPENRFYRKSVLFKHQFYRKSVSLGIEFYRKSVFFSIEIYRKSVFL